MEKPKTHLRNIRETKEFVINIVTYELAEAMNQTSGEYDASVNEFDLAQVAPAPSQVVKVPRVAPSPVSFECQLYQILDFSTSPESGSLVIGQIVSIHVNDAHLKQGRLDRNSLDLIGRMGGIQYTRTTAAIRDGAAESGIEIAFLHIKSITGIYMPLDKYYYCYRYLYACILVLYKRINYAYNIA